MRSVSLFALAFAAKILSSDVPNANDLAVQGTQILDSDPLPRDHKCRSFSHNLADPRIVSILNRYPDKENDALAFRNITLCERELLFFEDSDYDALDPDPARGAVLRWEYHDLPMTCVNLPHSWNGITARRGRRRIKSFFTGPNTKCVFFANPDCPWTWFEDRRWGQRYCELIPLDIGKRQTYTTQEQCNKTTSFWYEPDVRERIASFHCQPRGWEEHQLTEKMPKSEWVQTWEVSPPKTEPTMPPRV